VPRRSGQQPLRALDLVRHFGSGGHTHPRRARGPLHHSSREGGARESRGRQESQFARQSRVPLNNRRGPSPIEASLHLKLGGGRPSGPLARLAETVGALRAIGRRHTGGWATRRRQSSIGCVEERGVGNAMPLRHSDVIPRNSQLTDQHPWVHASGSTQSWRGAWHQRVRFWICCLTPSQLVSKVGHGLWLYCYR